MELFAEVLDYYLLLTQVAYKGPVDQVLLDFF